MFLRMCSIWPCILRYPSVLWSPQEQDQPSSLNWLGCWERWHHLSSIGCQMLIIHIKRLSGESRAAGVQNDFNEGKGEWFGVFLWLGMGPGEGFHLKFRSLVVWTSDWPKRRRMGAFLSARFRAREEEVMVSLKGYQQSTVKCQKWSQILH